MGPRAVGPVRPRANCAGACTMQPRTGRTPHRGASSTRTMDPTMSTIARAIELSAESSRSFDDAIQTGIARARQTLQNLKSVWVKDQEILLDGENPRYRVWLKATFELSD